MSPTKGVPPIMVRTLDPDRSEDLCHWFLQCEEEAYADVVHPSLGDVPICERHLAWIQEEE